MLDLIMAAVNKKPITDEMLAYELYEICDRVHSSCNNDCPVYRLNGGKVPYDDEGSCPYHKHGIGMLKFIRGHENDR